MAAVEGTQPSLDPSRPSTMVSSWPSRLLGPLEEMPWLEKASTTVLGWLEPLLNHPRAPRVKDALHGRWLGHSLHPIMTDLPIGFWTSAFVLDLVGARKSARMMTAAGCVTAVGAAVTGITDWTVSDGRERRLGMAHGLLNVAGLGCQVMALVSPRRSYRAWSWTGYTVSTAAAYLGGELVFGRGLMVDHDAWLAGPEKWTAVLKESTLADGATHKVRVDGRDVLLCRAGRTVSAIENACAHAGGPLDEGEVSDGVVTCPWHGSRFRLSDGACLQGPSTFPQLRLEVRVRDGQVEVRGRRG